jgi:hypothetical protein
VVLDSEIIMNCSCIFFVSVPLFRKILKEHCKCHHLDFLSVKNDDVVTKRGSGRRYEGLRTSGRIS